MTWLDWALLAVLLYSFLHGLRRGPLIGLLSTVGLLAGYVVAAGWYSSLADVLTLSLHLDKAWAATAAFVALLVAVYVVIGVVVTILLVGRLVSAPVRILGGLFGAGKGVVMGALLLVITLASPVGAMVRTDAERSRLMPPVLQGYKAALKAVTPYLPSMIHLPDADKTLF